MTESPEDPGAALADPRRRRLLFRAEHRGTKEADLLIGGFVRRELAALTEEELDQLEAILDMPDVDLTEWLMGRRAVPEDAQLPLLMRMLAEARAR